MSWRDRERGSAAASSDLADTVARLRWRGVRVVGTDGQATANVLEHRFERPAVLILGNDARAFAIACVVRP